MRSNTTKQGVQLSLRVASRALRSSRLSSTNTKATTKPSDLNLSLFRVSASNGSNGTRQRSTGMKRALQGALLVLAAGATSGGVLLCARDERLPNPKKEASWREWLPHSSQPSAESYRSNVANVAPPSVSSGEAAQASMGVRYNEPGGRFGVDVANDAVGNKIIQIGGGAAAVELAANARLSMPVEHAILTKAPLCPPRITRDYPVLLHVALETTAKVMQLTNRLKYEFWTFNDMVPGPMIRARVGDVVELTLKNTDRTGNPHNIDCHGFEGPGGGAPITTAQAGESKTARFKLLYPGLYVYHCAAAPVPAHIMNGMYGLMLIQPEYDTLPPVDREYYVMQSEFYHEPLDNTDGNSIVEPSYPRGLDEMADVVVFNGKESSLTTDSPLQAKTGEHVRVYFGNAGPNLTSSFHIIGAIFEKVWRDSDLMSPPGRFIQTISVPPGGSSVVDVHPVVPGTYTLVDHAIFRLDKGCVGYLNVTGKDRPDVYAGGDPQPCPGCKLHP